SRRTRSRSPRRRPIAWPTRGTSPCTRSGAWWVANPRRRPELRGFADRVVGRRGRRDADTARRRLLPVEDDAVDQAVVRGLLRAHEVVALDVRVDPLDRLPGVVGQDLL